MNPVYTKKEIDAQREIDERQREEHWARIEREAGGGDRGRAIADAFRKLYTLYKPEMVEWYASLYDPAVGGFYSTESGRDYEGFGPDLECTMQTLTFIAQSGLIREIGELSEAIPADMQKAMVRFAKSRQNENGFFYHPHWSFDDIESSLSRRGRDLGWGIRILETFGAKPTYDTPNGKKGDYLDADGKPVLRVISSNENSEPVQEEKPKPTHAPYLENKESFIEYLESMDLKNKSYHWGNQLNSTVGQIKARAKILLEQGADYDFREMLLDFLDSKINPETGYWGDCVNMAGSNGFFKIMAVYNGWGRLYPAVEKATESVLLSIMGDEIDAGNCCSVFNLWSGISFIKSNVQKFAPEELRDRLLERVDEVLRTRGAEAIINTYNKMLPYRKGAAFSHRYSGNGGTQQGLYTGMTAIYKVADEGNVDATGICCTGLTRTLFESFGMARVPVFGKADWMKFINIVSAAKPVVKKYPQEPLYLLDNEDNVRFAPPLADAEWSIKDGAMELSLEADGHGVCVERTTRLCKGSFVAFETELALSEISEEGTLSVAVCKNKNPLSISMFADFKIKGGNLTVGCEKWDEGFSYDFGKLPEVMKLRIEYYLSDRERADKKGSKCTSERVYLNGVYLGTAVNNDGRDPLFPTGSALHYNGNIMVYSKDALRGKMRIKSVSYSYPKEDAYFKFEG